MVRLGETVLAELLGTTLRDDRATDHGSGDRPNLTEQVYEQLIDLLIRGELRPGDVIIEVNRRPVNDADDAVTQSRPLKDGSVLLRVWNQGRSRYVVVDTTKPLKR
jgi:C-terminal processing protease CtpA/Prc